MAKYDNLLNMALCLKLKYLTFLFLTINIPLIVAQDYTTTVITDPSVSRRCGELLEDLKLKKNHHQKIKELLKRNQHSQKITPPAKNKVKNILTNNHKKLQRELDLTAIKIQHQEENIIRRGCPGITI